ncbi:MAG TPA: SprT-like domain-containing protein [Noviherbaspirillum sp.]|nr:SprT-like domain-containing protein [Noviherbaspirillum sp.]
MHNDRYTKHVRPVPPTLTIYRELQTAFEHFNAQLFGGALPDCVITLQRQKKTQAYFSFQRWGDTETRVYIDEIALNPEYFVLGIRETMQSMVHEQAHLWQYHFGTPGRKRYHNAEWADKMQAIGLMPTSTGKPGGKRTGESISDYVIEGGPFESAFKELMTTDFTFRWLDRFPASVQNMAHTLNQLPEEVQLAITEQEAHALAIRIVEQEPKKVTQWRYMCPMCELKVWGKPSLQIKCMEHDVQLEGKGVGEQ